jgi:thiol-disulfide isomerase/thioredoxin
VNSRARFLAILGGALALGSRRRGADAGWHHVHGPNGLALSTTTPLDLTFVTVDGSQFRLADHRGELVVVNLFASWCAPCNAEAPDVTAFAVAHAADTLVVSVRRQPRRATFASVSQSTIQSRPMSRRACTRRSA